MSGESHSNSTARIHLLAAREAPYVVVLRRKPTKRCHVIRWNTETDELEYGSWFHGRLYEMRCDVSPDGKYLIYLAMGDRGQTWNGLCLPPFLRTITDWPNVGAWNGGGYFPKANELYLNFRFSPERISKEQQARLAKVPLKISEIPNGVRGEDETVLYPRLERDGFVRVGPMPLARRGPNKQEFTWVVTDDPGWEFRPTPNHPALRIRYRGYFHKRGRVFEFDIPEYPAILDSEVTWAAYDSLGQLVFARRGVLYRFTLGDLKVGTPSAVIDLEPLVPPTEPRTDLPNFPFEDEEEVAEAEDANILVVSEAIQDQPVSTIVLPISNSKWVKDIHRLAGEYLAGDLADRDPSPIIATPAYYLRQHNILHIREPLPTAGIEALFDAVTEVFAWLSGLGGSSIAMRPLGLDSGWDFETAAKATVEAAQAFVESEPEAKVLLVAETDEQSEILRALLG